MEEPPRQARQRVRDANLSGTIMPALMVLIGAALLVRSLAGGGGPLAVGVVMGVLFIAAGVGRLYVERRSA